MAAAMHGLAGHQFMYLASTISHPLENRPLRQNDDQHEHMAKSGERVGGQTKAVIAFGHTSNRKKL